MKQRTSKRIDIAYTIFLVTGLIFVFFVVIEFLVTEYALFPTLSPEYFGALFGMFVFLPLVLLIPAAHVLAIVISFMSWREWPLLILSLVSVLFFSQIRLQGGDQTEQRIAFLLSGLIFMLFGLQYFLCRRPIPQDWRTILGGWLTYTLLVDVVFYIWFLSP